jgi:hypothetical protein
MHTHRKICQPRTVAALRLFTSSYIILLSFADIFMDYSLTKAGEKLDSGVSNVEVILDCQCQS